MDADGSQFAARVSANLSKRLPSVYGHERTLSSLLHALHAVFYAYLAKEDEDELVEINKKLFGSVRRHTHKVRRREERD